MRFHNGVTTVWLLFLSAGVSGQLLDIVNVKTIRDKSTFTITCDASRVQRPPEDSNVDSVYGLIIRINSTAVTNLTNVAQYHPSGALPVQREYKAIPTGRDWIVSYTGGYDTNNINTIRIEILVRDVKCTDAGYYSCKMQYLDSNGVFKEPTMVQYVSAEATTTGLVLSLDPLSNGPNDAKSYSEYYLNTTVTMTCRVDGTQDLVIIWRREIRPAIGLYSSYEKYPHDNDASSHTQLVPVTGVCNNYRHTSKLKLFVSSADRNRAYQCVIQANGVDVLITGAIVNVITPSVTAAGPDTLEGFGLLVGVMIGCFIAILFIVGAIILYVRPFERNKEKDNSDMHDGGVDKYGPHPITISPRKRSSANSEHSKRGSNAAHSKRDSIGRDGNKRQNMPHDENSYRKKERKPYFGNEGSKPKIAPKPAPKHKLKIHFQYPTMKDDDRQLQYAQTRHSTKQKQSL